MLPENQKLCKLGHLPALLGAYSSVRCSRPWYGFIPLLRPFWPRDCPGSMFSISLPCRCYSILSHELLCARRGGVCVWPFLISPKILLRIFFQMRQICASHSHMPRYSDSPLAKVCKSISHTKSMVEITELSKKLKGALCLLNTVAILCMAMSFYGLISKKAGEMACLLLPFLPHIAFYKTGDQLLKISKPRGGEMQAALLLKYVE